MKAETRLPAVANEPDAAASLVLAALLDVAHPNAAVGAERRSWSSDPPFVRANRDLLRWHCALTI